MPNHIRHFAVPADDTARARAFYTSAFGWRFEPWGPPGFHLIHTGQEGDHALQGALQERAPGASPRGYECTIGVDDLDATLEAVARSGGAILSAPFVIAGVGRVAYVADTEGNRVGVMQYDAA